MENNQPPLSNVPQWSVSELSQALKRTLEENYAFVRLRGEVSGYRGPHSSGHVYFSIKDTNARIDAIIWKGAFSKLRFKPEEGLEIIATGKISSFPGKSSYQIIIEHIEPAGAGALMMMLEERRKKLTSEGLFDPARKQILPKLPQTIAVITSPTGSVIRDILHRLHDRFPLHVLVYPVRVQGETCADEVTNAILDLNTLSPHSNIPTPDLIIIARGGGSLEDLWGFNEENVVRAAANSFIPIISAIGHETDWTLLDMAADVRAPTPTAAAEMAVPVKFEILNQINALQARSQSALNRTLSEQKLHLRALSKALPKATDLLSGKSQSLDLLEQKALRALQTNISKKRNHLNTLANTLSSHHPQMRLAKQHQRLNLCAQNLSFATKNHSRKKHNQFEILNQKLKPSLVLQHISQGQKTLQAQARLLISLSHKGVLERGFAYVTNESGKLVSRAAQIETKQTLRLSFADGTKEVSSKQ